MAANETTAHRDWTQCNTYRMTTRMDGEQGAARDHSWGLTGALRWFGGVLEQEWISHHGTKEWLPVPTVMRGDTL